VKDTYGCVKTTSVTITQPSAITLTATTTNPNCYGGTGSITVTATGGTGTFTYSKDGTNYQASNVFANLTAGSYTIRAKDENACIKTANVSITQPTAITLSINKVNSVCYGGSGSATATVSGGTSPYTYLWSSGQTTSSVPNLYAGVYSLTVTDSKGCQKTSSVTLTQPTEILLSTTVTNSNCYGGSGSITVIASGGTGTKTYSKDGANFQVSNVFTNLSAGNYTITVKDANACVKSTSVTITQPEQLTANIVSTNFQCYAETNGSADISVTGGTIPYSYTWSNGSTTQDLTGVVAGTYTLTVVDANSCSISKDVTITASEQLIANAGNDTTISIGDAIQLGEIGNPLYTYSWSPATGLSNPNIANPFAEPTTTTNYTLTLSNGNCQATDDVMVMVTGNQIFDLTGTITYDNTANTAMNNCVVKLMKNSSIVATTTTDSNGNYAFDNLLPDDYTIHVSTTKDWGGVNATDALTVQNHYVGNTNITGRYLKGADVNVSNNVNSTDALLIKKRFSLLSNSFPSGDWYIDSIPVTLDSDTVIDIKALCFGDVNGSYFPAGAKAINTVGITSNGTINTSNGSSVTIPISVTNNMEVGAVSLILTYPAESMQITSVESTVLTGMITNIVEGKVYVAWSSTDGVNLENGNTILTLQAQVISTETGSIDLGLLPGSELANRSAEVISGIELTAPTITTQVTNINAQTALENAANIYPNPSHDGKLTIEISKFESGMRYKVYDVDGRLLKNEKIHGIKTEIDLGKYSSGNYKVEIVSSKGTITKAIVLTKN
jgi:hypothetical protein